MGAASNYLENALLNHVLRNTAYTSPGTSVYVALFDTTASLANLEAGTLTGEITTVGSAYARVQVTAWDAPTTGATQNTNQISFTQATAAWGTLRFVAVMDAVTAGNVLFYGQLTADKTINSGDQFVINAGDLDITLD